MSDFWEGDPGFHFGNVEELNQFVGNVKYAIFSSTKGLRSIGSEIANGNLMARYVLGLQKPLGKHFYL